MPRVRRSRSAVSTAQAAAVAPHSSRGHGRTTRSVASTAQDGGGSRATATSRVASRGRGRGRARGRGQGRQSHSADRPVAHPEPQQEGTEPPEDLTYLQSLIREEIQRALAQGETTPDAS